MEIFISWSGPRSKAFALELKDWLKMCIQAVNPWMSAHDIEKGKRWGEEISSKLTNVSFGIICCTGQHHCPLDIVRGRCNLEIARIKNLDRVIGCRTVTNRISPSPIPTHQN